MESALANILQWMALPRFLLFVKIHFWLYFFSPWDPTFLSMVFSWEQEWWVGSSTCVLPGHGHPLEGIGHTHTPPQPMDAATQARPSRFWSGWQEVGKRVLWLTCFERCRASWISALNRYNMDKVEGFGTSALPQKEIANPMKHIRWCGSVRVEVKLFKYLCFTSAVCVQHELNRWTDVICVLFLLLSRARSPRVTSTELLSPATNLSIFSKCPHT